MVKTQKSVIRTMAALLVILSVTMLFTACGSNGNNSTSAAAKTESTTAGQKKLVTVRVPKPTSVTEYYIANKLGFFEEEGIKLEEVKLGDGVTVEQAAAQGLIDYITGGHPTNIARARLAGIDAVATHPGMVDNDKTYHIAYYQQSTGKLQGLKDLASPNPNRKDGKWLFGVGGTGTCITGYPLYYLNLNKLNTQNVQFVQLEEASLLQSLVSGQLDIAAVHSGRQPEADGLIKAGKVNRIASSWDIFADPYAGLSVRGFLRSFIDKHKDDGVIQGFSNAHYKARVWLNANRDLALQYAKDDFGIDPSKQAYQVFTEDTSIKKEAIDRWFEIAYVAGELKKEDKVKPEDTFTNDFAAKVTESKESIIARRPK